MCRMDDIINDSRNKKRPGELTKQNKNKQKSKNLANPPQQFGKPNKNLANIARQTQKKPLVKMYLQTWFRKEFVILEEFQSLRNAFELSVEVKLFELGVVTAVPIPFLLLLLSFCPVSIFLRIFFLFFFRFVLFFLFFFLLVVMSDTGQVADQLSDGDVGVSLRPLRDVMSHRFVLKGIDQIY